MELSAVKKAYARWAPVYDALFGPFARMGRLRAVDIVNRRNGRVLEVGVGTGLSLPRYKRSLRVTGVDVSTDMLERARERVSRQRLTHVEALREMDAENLNFPDGSFDVVVAMYLLPVVPEPARVMAELERVCAPDGEVVIVNHFATETGPRAAIERAMAPFADVIGWHSDFRKEVVLDATEMRLIEERSAPPAGLFTILRLRRDSALERVAA